MVHVDLKIIEGGSTGRGSEEWAKKVRSETKSLSKQIDKAYIELAEMLYTIFDTPAHGDGVHPPIFTAFWGYSSFPEYVQEELGIHPKRAQRLIRIWYKLGIQLGDLDKDLKKRIAALGFSKVRELVRVLTYKNASAWVDKAEQLSYLKLCKLIEKYISERDRRDAERMAQEQINGSNPTPQTPGILHDPAASDLDPVAVAPVEYDELEDLPVADIKPEETIRKTFEFYPDQMATVEQALQRSAQLSNSDKRSHNLSLICLDFLATNDFAKADEAQRLRFLQKFEKLLGFKLIIVDPSADEVVYGIDTLTKLANGAG